MSKFECKIKFFYPPGADSSDDQQVKLRLHWTKDLTDQKKADIVEIIKSALGVK